MYRDTCARSFSIPCHTCAAQGIEKAKSVGFLDWASPNYGGFNIEEVEHYEMVWDLVFPGGTLSTS